MVSETKIYNRGYSKPIRRDGNSHSGGLLIYIRNDIPFKEIETQKLPDDIEGIFIEINLHNNNWIIMGGYNPQKRKYLLFNWMGYML